MSNAVAKINFDSEQMKVIEAHFFPAGASVAEQQYCFSVAKELGLNPITKEVYFVNRRQKVGDKWVSKVEPMVSRDGYVSIAHRSGQLAGMETVAAIREVPKLMQGEWLYVQDLMAECKVWRKDSSKPFTVQVAYSEYCQRSNDGTPTKFWVEKPETMLKKVAESQALRKAFNIHGVYCPEELGAGFENENGEIITQPIEAEFTSSVPDPVQKQPAQIENKSAHPAVMEAPKSTLSPSPAIKKEIDPESEEGWPLPPGVNKVTPALESACGDIISLLESKNISFDIDYQNGILSAKSYHERQMLKDLGFKWNGDAKSWIFKFETDPF